MAKWDNLKRKKLKSSKNNKRFLTSIDMMEAKRAEAIANAKFKRGEVKVQFTHIVACGCGVQGCVFCSYPLMPV